MIQTIKQIERAVKRLKSAEVQTAQVLFVGQSRMHRRYMVNRQHSVLFTFKNGRIGRCSCGSESLCSHVIAAAVQDSEMFNESLNLCEIARATESTRVASGV